MRKIYALIAMMLFAVCPMAMAEEAAAAEKEISWSSPVNYFSEGLNAGFSATIVGYTDGTYAIKGIYGSEDDLEFTIDSESVVENIPEIVLTNYYAESAPYYYFHAGKYDFCTYYVKGTGYTGWEGDAEEPCLWFYTYLYEGENYVGAGYDTVYWNKADASSISSPKAGASASDRITSLSGINYSQSVKLPAGLYVKNGKKVLVTK